PAYLSRFCFALPRHVLGCWARPRSFGFLYQQFSSLVVTKPSIPKPAKQKHSNPTPQRGALCIASSERSVRDVSGPDPRNLEPRAGLEPATCRLRIERF